MKHTKYQNHKNLQDAGDITQWLQDNINGLVGKPISVSTNIDGTVREIEIGKKLNANEKQLIVDQFPELKGKEIEV